MAEFVNVQLAYNCEVEKKYAPYEISEINCAPKHK
jgi:hypothetical protein